MHGEPVQKEKVQGQGNTRGRGGEYGLRTYQTR